MSDTRRPSHPSHTSRPGRDRRAVLHRAVPGAATCDGSREVAVIGGGIAGLAAAVALAERGVRVTLFEATDRLGGRVAAWPIAEGRTMSRGFHAFFRQYYNLRALLRRADPTLARLVPVPDYPLQRPDGLSDSFAGLRRTPPWSVLQFVWRSPSFKAATLARVNVSAALELLRVRFPETYGAYGGESAAAFLDRLRFPQDARDLALEVFARSFFADPREFAAGELVAMFHTYFMGSAEGLLFDVPDDDYQTALWGPLGDYLQGLGVRVRLDSPVEAVAVGSEAKVVAGDGVSEFDAIVLAADPRTARELVQHAEVVAADERQLSDWRAAVQGTVNAPPFVVLRLWLGEPVRQDRPAFVGTSGYGPLDNVSVLERFEAGAREWARANHGSVIELHAYACDRDLTTDSADALIARLVDELHRIFPETATAPEISREVLIRDDCTLITPTGWAARPGVITPSPRLVLAGDWVRCDYPVALMERAATTGFLAANALLSDWGIAGEDLWTVPMRGLLAR